MKKWTTGSVCALFVAASAFSRPLFAANLTLITPSAGFTGVDIWGVSGDGKTVLGDQENASLFRGTRWTVATLAQSDLGLLSGFPYSEGEYLDSNGGIAAVDAISSSLTPKIYQWTSPSAQTVVPFMQSGNFTYAEGISSDGSVIAGWGNTTSASTPQRLSRWTASGGVVVIPLPSDTLYTSALPDQQASKILSGNGQFIIGNTNDVAFRYDNATGITSDIGQMQSGNVPHLTSISNDGSEILGYSPYDFPDFIDGQAGFLWTSTSGFVSLGSLGGEGDTIIPRFLSGDGKTVLGTDRGVNFIWTQATGMVSFSNYLASLGVDMSALQDVSFSGISDDGTTIVGRAETSSNALVGWVVSTASAPEPASLALLAVGAGSLLLRRRRA